MSNLVENSVSFSLAFLDPRNEDGFLCGARNALRGNANLYLCFPPTVNSCAFLKDLEICQKLVWEDEFNRSLSMVCCILLQRAVWLQC